MMLVAKILACFLLCYSLASKAKILVISDLDATVKQSNVHHTQALVQQYLSGHDFKPFVFTRDLYRNIYMGHLPSEFVYITAAPYLFPSAEWLEENKFPKGAVYYRKWGDIRRGTLKYKKKILKQVLQKHSQDPRLVVYFFGDNHQHDPAAYQFALKLLKEGQRGHIFIRDVRGNFLFAEKDSNQTTYVSERELFKHQAFKRFSGRNLSALEESLEKGEWHWVWPEFQIDYFIERAEQNLELNAKDAQAFIELKLSEYINIIQ